MSQEAVERLLGRLLTDDGFRKQAENSLEKLCWEGGYVLNPSELKAISRDYIIGLDTPSSRLDSTIKRV